MSLPRYFKILLSSLVLLILSFSLVNFSLAAQGTRLSIGKVELTEGDKATIYVTLDEAISGLGRLDATIVSSKPAVLELLSINPEAVSPQFIQIDSQEKGRIKFKLVDLGKKVDPGDKDVQLLSLEVQAVKQGESELSFAGVKYSDEEGNVIEPSLKSATITVQNGTKTPEETEMEREKTKKVEERSQLQAESEPEEKAEKEKKTEQEKETAEPSEEVKEKRKNDKTEKDQGYAIDVKGIRVKMGEKEKIALDLKSLPEGLQMSHVWLINSGGVSFESVEVLNPDFSEIMRLTEKLVEFRAGDFDSSIEPGTDNLRVAEITLKGVVLGQTNLRAKLAIWTDKGDKLIRISEIPAIEVTGTVGNAGSPPGDIDGDGLYEDVNGDGKLSKKDVFVLAFNLDTDAIQNSPSLFDFNWDGEASFSDAVKLLSELGED